MSAVISSFAAAAVLLAGAGLLRRGAGPRAASRVAFGLAAWISLLLLVAYWMIDHLSGEGINDAAWYHLTYGLGGAGFGEYRRLIGVGVVGIAVATAMAVVLAGLGRDNGRAPSDARRAWLGVAVAVVSILLNPALRDIARQLWPAAPETASFRRLYLQPHAEAVRPTHPNLVYIYAEGMERTYLDESLFPGLTPGLRSLEEEATSFMDVRQVGMTGYTIAGIVASQCGIPLSPLQFEGNRMASMDRYLPGATALGDLLAAEGYHLVYMGGAPLWFAGKGTFFRTHGFAEVFGREELLPEVEDKDYVSGWGLYDDTLLELAYQRFEDLSRTRAPFGLFLLTLDTHSPDGHRSRSGANVIHGDGSNPMLNAVRASDQLISAFVRRIRASPHAADTVVVIASDHLALPNSATPLLDKGTRRNLFLVLEPGQRTARRVTRRGSTLDIGPTLLPFLGFRGAIGLGRDLRDPAVTEQQIEEIADAVDRGVWREEIARFWEFPVLRRMITIDTDNARAVIDGDRTFWIPMLVRFDAAMETRFEFAWDLKGADRAIVRSVSEMAEGTPFLLIDRCENVGSLGLDLGDAGWCVIAGTGRDIRTARRIEGPTTFSRDEVRAMTGGWQD